MLEFFVGDIFVQCGGRVFEQTVGILMVTNCTPLLADLSLHSCERKKERRLAISFNLSIRYIDEVLSLVSGI